MGWDSTQHDYARPVTSSTERRGSIRHGGAVVAVAMGGMNLALYVFTALAARLLGPQDYGALASLMAVLLVVSVLQLGIQTTAARRISADPEHVAQIEREILRLTLRAAAVIGVACCSSPPRRSTGCCASTAWLAAVLRRALRRPAHHLGRPARRPAGRAPLVAGGGALPRERRPPPGRSAPR